MNCLHLEQFLYKSEGPGGVPLIPEHLCVMLIPVGAIVLKWTSPDNILRNLSWRHLSVTQLDVWELLMTCHWIDVDCLSTILTPAGNPDLTSDKTGRNVLFSGHLSAAVADIEIVKWAGKTA